MRRSLLAATLLVLLCVVTAVLGIAGFGAMPLLAGGTLPQPSTAPANSAQKIAVFNMAAVMKGYGKAKYEVYKLSEERMKLRTELAAPKMECLKLQLEIQQQQNPDTKEKMQQRQTDLTREIEDKNRKIDQQLDDMASAVIVLIYDEIKDVMDKIAEAKGYDIVFAYPDAVTPEDAKNPYMKEMKLKPPAAQPFFVAKHLDLTEAVIKELNEHYPAPPVPQSPPQLQFGFPQSVPQKVQPVPPPTVPNP